MAIQQANQGGAAMLLWLLLSCLALVPSSSATCAALTPATLTPGAVPEEAFYEASVNTGAIVRISQVDTAWDALNVGGWHDTDCSLLHWGLEGPLRLRCDAGNGAALTADLSGCRLVGCIWHRHALLPATGPYLVSLGAEVDGGGLVSTGQWSSMVLAGNGAFYAPPMNARGVLRIEAAGSSASMLSGVDLGQGVMKYISAVLGPDGRIYAIPYSALKVLQIDPATDAVLEIGDEFTESYKWSHAVLAHDGVIYGIPAYASGVLRLDPVTGQTNHITTGVDSSGAMKWSCGVVAANGMIFGIPSNSQSILRIDPTSGSVSQFGNFGAMARKWGHGLLGIDGRIYAVPSSATAVLRIEPTTSTASVSLGAGLPTDKFKWSMGVAASDGKIYCIPRSSAQVLMIDPMSSITSLLGSVSSTVKWKWQYGILAPDGFIYAIPAGERKVLRIDTRNGTIEQVGIDLGPSQQKYEAAALAPNGAIYATPSSTSRVLRLRPEEDMCTRAPLGLNVTCTLGMACGLTLTTPEGKRGALGSLNSLWISPVQDRCAKRGYVRVVGITNPLSTSTDVATLSRTFEFGTGTEGVPSTMNPLCWAQTSSSPNVVKVGFFNLHGPQQNLIAHCVVGVPCIIAVKGIGLSLGSSLLVIPGAERCGSIFTRISAIPGLTNPHNLSTADAQGDTIVEHHLGVTRTGNSGVYSLCWAQSGGENATSYLVPLGQMRLAGPQFLESAESEDSVVCWVGSLCTIKVEGTDLSAANRISVREDCDLGPVANIAGFNTVAVPDASGQHYDFGIAREGGRQLLFLCWHSTASSPGVFFRRVQIYGTINGGFLVECTIGQSCNFTMDNNTFYGVSWATSMQNRVRLVSGSGSACPGDAATLWSGASNPARPLTDSVISFDFGVPDAFSYEAVQLLMGDYTVCWAHDGLTFQMNTGLLRVLDLPCTVPMPQHSLWPPCSSADQGGAAVTVLSHWESCSPRCKDDYSPSVASLTCQYGQVVPPAHMCRKSCLRAPYVTNGNDHSFCAGLKHGELCPIQCPAGSIKSGDLECRDGHFAHVPGLPPELLFDVPRCYRNCNAQAAGCGADAGPLRHGGKCRAACADGAAPSVSEVRCMDGIVGPEFTCSRVCAQPPSIPNSRGLDPCRGAFSGARCNLQCEVGYVPSGSPVCNDGTWTIETCIPPCAQPVVANADEVPCDGLEVIVHGAFCKPMCAHGYTPEVDMTSVLVPDFRGPGLQCSEGLLTPTTFVCRASCMTKPQVEHAHDPSLKECIGTIHGQSCVTPCVFGYRKTNDLACLDGVFSAATCVKECVEPPQVEHMLPNSVCRNLGPGETCEIECIHGFAPSAVAVCQEGGVYSSIQCKRMCFAPSNVANAMSPSCLEGSAVKDGGICTAHCAAGFTPSAERLACNEGELRPRLFSCQRYCGVPNEILHASDLSGCASVEVGGTCAVQCASGFQTSGSLRCEADGWRDYFGRVMLGSQGMHLKRGFLLDSVKTTPEFVLTFDFLLSEKATNYYQSIFHFTATESNCCQVGDRVPAIFVAPALDGLDGREVHVFLDGGPGCLARDGVKVGVKSHVVVSFLAGVLKMSIDGKTLCQEVYSQGVASYSDVSVYSSSPWHEAAVAEVQNVAYDPIMPDEMAVQCEQVRCHGELPVVPGARTDLLSGTSCKGAVFDSTCQDVPCPFGLELSGKFVCNARGKWQSEGGQMVSCVRKSCPELLPVFSPMAATYSCSSHKYGDVCAVKCQPGYESNGAYKCAANAAWEEVDGVTPTCNAMPCGAPPVVMNGVTRDICSRLPSDMLCEADCVDGYQPVGEYRCMAQVWTDVPVCVEVDMLEEASQGEKRAVVKGGLAALPSSDVLEALGLPGAWASNVYTAAADALKLYLNIQLNKTMAVHVLGIVGSAGASTFRRRLEENVTDISARWRADLGFLVVPPGPSAADAQAVYTSLAALTAGELAGLLLEVLPGFARPQAVDVMLSAPRLGEIPALVLEVLPDLLSQTTTSEGPLRSTFAPWTTELTTTTNTTTTSSTEELGYMERMRAMRARAYKKAVDVGKIVIWGSVPLALLMSGILFWRFMKQARRYASQTSKSDRRDYNYSIETWTNESVEDGFNQEAIFQYQLEKEARLRQQNLEHILLDAREPHEHIDEHGQTIHVEPQEDDDSSESEDPHRGARFDANQRGDAGYAQADAGGIGTRDHCATTAHWDIKNAGKLEDSDKYKEKLKGPRRVAKHRSRRSKTVKMAHEKYLKERTFCQRFNKFIKRFFYILLCGTKIARELEDKRASKEGRKARGFASLEVDAKKQSKKVIADAELTRKSQRKSMKNAMVMAGVPPGLAQSFLGYFIFSKDQKAEDLKAALNKANSEKADGQSEVEKKDGEEGDDEEGMPEGTESTAIGPTPSALEEAGTESRPMGAAGTASQGMASQGMASQGMASQGMASATPQYISAVASDLGHRRDGTESMMGATGSMMSATASMMSETGTESMAMKQEESMPIHMSVTEHENFGKYDPEVAEEDGIGAIPQGEQGLQNHEYHAPTKKELAAMSDQERELHKLKKMSPEEYEEYQQDIINDFFEYEELDEMEMLAREMAARNKGVNLAEDMQAGNVVRILKDTNIDFANQMYIERITTRFDVPKRKRVERLKEGEEAEKARQELLRKKAGEESSSATSSDIMSGDVPTEETKSTGSEGAKIVGYGNETAPDVEEEEEKALAKKGDGDLDDWLDDEGEESEEESGESELTQDFVMDDEEGEEEEGGDEPDQPEPEEAKVEIENQRRAMGKLSAINQGDIFGDDPDEIIHHHHHHHDMPHVDHHWGIVHDPEPEDDHPPEPPTDPKILEAIQKARERDIYKEQMVTERSEAAKLYWGIDPNAEHGALGQVGDLLGFGHGDHGHHRSHHGSMFGSLFSKFWCASAPMRDHAAEHV